MSIFITFEGIEGCGKSTQVRLLSESLKAQDRQHLLTREPGGCPIADSIRAILLDPANSALFPRSELLLYAAARAQHVSEVMRPALSEDKIVICDRYVDATLAYQGYGRGLDLQMIEELNELASDGLTPDVTILLDMPCEEGLKRAKDRNTAMGLGHEDRFEQESLEFHRKVRDGYLKLAEQNPRRFRIVNAVGTPQDVARRISETLSPNLDDRYCS